MNWQVYDNSEKENRIDWYIGYQNKKGGILIYREIDTKNMK